MSASNFVITGAALPTCTSQRGPMSSMRMFSSSARSACRLFSRKMARRAPRLSASMPTLPEPAYASRNTAPSMRGARMLNSASRSRSGVGRTVSPWGVFSRRDRNSPPMTRIASLPAYPTSASP